MKLLFPRRRNKEEHVLYPSVPLRDVMIDHQVVAHAFCCMSRIFCQTCRHDDDMVVLVHNGEHLRLAGKA